jgi:hypothetical protein
MLLATSFLVQKPCFATDVSNDDVLHVDATHFKGVESRKGEFSELLKRTAS